MSFLSNIQKCKAESTKGCFLPEGDRVPNGLALTPSEMLELSRNGVPIASQFDSSQFDDGSEDPSITPDLFSIRGLDAVDVWNYQQDCRSRVLNAHKVDRLGYGDVKKELNIK